MFKASRSVTVRQKRKRFDAYRRHVVERGDRVEPKALQQALHKHQSATLNADGESLIRRKESERENDRSDGRLAGEQRRRRT